MESPQNTRGRRSLFRRTLAILFILAAAGAIVLLYASHGSQTEKSTVNISVDGTLYESVPVGEERSVTIERNGNRNVILFERDGVRMLHSTCKNQICVNTGKLFYSDTGALDLNSWIVCLPNKVSVEVIVG